RLEALVARDSIALQVDLEERDGAFIRDGAPRAPRTFEIQEGEPIPLFCAEGLTYRVQVVEAGEQGGRVVSQLFEVVAAETQIDFLTFHLTHELASNLLDSVVTERVLSTAPRVCQQAAAHSLRQPFTQLRLV